MRGEIKGVLMKILLGSASRARLDVLAWILSFVYSIYSMRSLSVIVSSKTATPELRHLTTCKGSAAHSCH